MLRHVSPPKKEMEKGEKKKTRFHILPYAHNLEMLDPIMESVKVTGGIAWIFHVKAI